MASFKKSFLTVMVLVASISAAPKEFSIEIPDECKGKGFCSIKPEGYDEMQEVITELLSSTFNAQSIGDRLGEEDLAPKLSSEEDWHNCPYITTKEKMYTYSSLPNDTEPYYIIQNDLLSQPVEHIQCANDKFNSKCPCFWDLGLDSFDMKFSCQTTTAKQSLFVFEPKTKTIMLKSFDVPSGCSCFIDK